MPEHNGNHAANTATTATAGVSRSIATQPAAAEERPALETALAQVETIKTEFRNVIAGLNKLGDLLKQTAREQRVNEKEIQGVRQTLRSLQSVRI